jgi:hypothetical protein
MKVPMGNYLKMADLQRVKALLELGWSFDVFKFFVSGLFADLAPVLNRIK